MEVGAEITDPKNMAIFGTSAGGALTLSMVLRAKQDGLPLPAAIAPGTPMSDLTGTGDSFATNHMIDNVLVGSDGRCDAMAKLYANGHDLKDPMLSPVYGDMHGFPPTILTTGTRDLAAQQHRAGAPQVAPGRSRRRAAGLRRAVARAVPCGTPTRQRPRKRSRRSRSFSIGIWESDVGRGGGGNGGHGTSTTRSYGETEFSLVFKTRVTPSFSIGTLKLISRPAGQPVKTR